MIKKITRTGVYGLAITQGRILLVTQRTGPYVGKYDLPGGGLEHGETFEEALRREFLEEVGMQFDCMQLLSALTTQVNYIFDLDNTERDFHQLGVIYSIKGLKAATTSDTSERLVFSWVEPSTLTIDNTSPFVHQTLKLFPIN
jgi:ADP-ribose pyrophosphatase YjhB (NUDIX family)